MIPADSKAEGTASPCRSGTGMGLPYKLQTAAGQLLQQAVYVYTIKELIKISRQLLLNL
jgi:hypothetical protein